MSLNLRFLVYIKLRVEVVLALKSFSGIMLSFTDLDLGYTSFYPQR